MRIRRCFPVLLAAMILALGALLCGCAASAPGGNGNGGGGGDDPLRTLTLEQKVGQLFLVGFQGTQVTPEIRQLFAEVHPGGVILFGRNIADEAQLAALIADLQALAGEGGGPPLFVAIDQEGGQVVRASWLGDDVSQAQLASPQQAYDLALARARGLRDVGVNLNLAPVLDAGLPGDFLTRYGRAFGGDPQRAGELGASVISGQREGGLLSAVKHFPGYGGIAYDPENDRLAVMPRLPELSQFQAAAGAGPEFVMTANVIYSDLDPAAPFTLSPAGISFLRDTLRGDYLIISDDLASKVLKEAYGLAQTATRAAVAGVDVLLIAGHEAGDVREAYAAVLAAARAGELAEAELSARVGAILRLKADARLH